MLEVNETKKKSFLEKIETIVNIETKRINVE